MKVSKKKVVRPAFSAGSALILAVVLTSLLAIIGVLFLMASRVNKIATSAISQTRELDLAVDTVVAQIAEQLALDVPRVDANGVLQDYYDYPDDKNAWLASLEPFESDKWLHVTDLYDLFGHQPFAPLTSLDADADGDGVVDSKWVELSDITSSKGWPIYAAIRVIDNGAMLNVNTAYKFDPTEVPLLPDRIDGSSLMQINLMALASQPGEPDPTVGHESDLLEARANYGAGGVMPGDLAAYERNVVWRYGEPNGPYTPFDISDELELRYRFLVNQDDIDSRLEVLGLADNRSWGFRTIRNFRRPVEGGELDEWFITAYGGTSLDPNYAYRHIATIYNTDRIIAPDGGTMVNVNTADKYVLRNRVTAALLDAYPDFTNASAAAAQIAANLIDFRDADEIVTAVDDVDGVTYYGFERPCVYISELVYKEDLGIGGKSYAVELHRPYEQDSDPTDWRLIIDNSRVSDADDADVPVVWSGTRQFHVIRWEDANVPLSAGFGGPNSPVPPNGTEWVNPNIVLRWPVVAGADSYDVYLGIYSDAVRDANTTVDPNNVYMGRWSDAKYAPAAPLDPNKTSYYWRIDPVDAGSVIGSGQVWSFMTAVSGSGYSMTAQNVTAGWSAGDTIFDVDSVIKLKRLVPGTGDYITVDSVQITAASQQLFSPTGQARSFQRDTTLHKCIRRLWDEALTDVTSSILGYANTFKDTTSPDIMIQAHPSNVDFVCIGDIGKVFVVDANLIRALDTEATVRIDLANPNYQRIFNYLTVFDPSADGINNDGDVNSSGVEIIDESDFDGDGYPGPGDELKIPGRININTAPWYVIEQLPWMTPQIAQAIAYYRHTPQGPFRSIGQLSDVNDIAPMFSGPYFSIYHYARADGPYVGDQVGFPDLTPADGAADDLEERDLLFARISNLVTVRSDVFTAYILVRIGPDGPQKRVMAILDRSDVYPDASGRVTGRVRIRALHPVPDPR